PEMGESPGEGRSGDAGDDGPHALRKVVPLNPVLRDRERREARNDPRRAEGAVDPCLRGTLVAEGPHLSGEVPEALRGNADLADEERPGDGLRRLPVGLGGSIERIRRIRGLRLETRQRRVNYFLLGGNPCGSRAEGHLDRECFHRSRPQGLRRDGICEVDPLDARSGPRELVQGDRNLRGIVECERQCLARAWLRLEAQGDRDGDEEFAREGNRRMEEVVGGPVVCDLLESDPRSMAVRRDRAERVHIRRESAAEGSEGSVPIDRVADGEIEGDRRDERHEVTRGEGIVVEALPESADLRDGPMSVPREEGADQSLPDELGEGRDADGLLDIVPVLQEAHITPPSNARMRARTGRGSVSPDAGSRRPRGRSPCPAAGSRGGRATDISS